MPWTAKVLGSNLSRTFFFSNGKFSVSNEIVGKLFVCLFIVSLAVISCNRFCCCTQCFFVALSV